MRRFILPVLVLCILGFVGLLIDPHADTPLPNSTITPTVYLYFPFMYNYPTSTPTATPTPTSTPTATPTTIPCQIFDRAWSKRTGWIDILFEVQGLDMIVSFNIHYQYGSQSKIQYVGKRTFTSEAKWYSYQDNLSAVWQPVDIEFLSRECVEEGD